MLSSWNFELLNFYNFNNIIIVATIGFILIEANIHYSLLT